MRVRRHERRLQRACLLEHDALQPAHRAVELLADVDRPEPRGRRDLIVATPARMQLGRDVADLGVQQPIDERVHVLVGRLRRLARFDSRGDGIQAALDRLALFERQHAGAPERYRPRLREPDIVRPEAEIDADGAVDLLEQRAGPGGKPPTPELVRWCRAGSGVVARHRAATLDRDARSDAASC